jgi:hypothetical protein
MKKLKLAAEWMWKHRGQNIWWKPAVLTSANPDTTKPDLNMVEALAVFRKLEEDALIFPVQHPVEHGTVYLINEVKEEEWTAFLRKRSLAYIYLVHPLVVLLKNLWTVIIWLLSVIIASFFAAWMALLLR